MIGVDRAENIDLTLSKASATSLGEFSCAAAMRLMTLVIGAWIDIDGIFEELQRRLFTENEPTKKRLKKKKNQESIL